MARTQLAFIGSTAIIEQISRAAGAEGVDSSEPVVVESPVDALDAPIGGQEIQHVAETVTIAASSSTAFALFFQKVIGMLKEQKEEALLVHDPASGKRLGIVTPETSQEEMEEMLS